VRTILIFLLFTRLLKPGLSQTLNYQDIFGDDWKKAISFEKENRSWMEPLLAKNNISYPLAISIIFPELVRYSALQDKIEITLLKALYVNLGDEYADFSIGQFQMKPSFAELIREKTPAVSGDKTEISFKNITAYDNIKDFRKSVVSDLEDPKSQIRYLIAFVKICDRNFNTDLKDEMSAVKFLSTAYNFGIDKNKKEIEQMIGRKFFNTKLIKTENYSYADVAVFWYNQYISDK
jgi:hypothetical protein